MKIEKIENGYRVFDGEYTQYFDNIEDAKTYIGLVGMFSIKYDELHSKNRKRKFFNPKRFTQPLSFLKESEEV